MNQIECCLIGKINNRLAILENMLEQCLDGTPPPPEEFTPPVGTALWLKADAISALDGEQIFTWPDSSGNGNDVTQPDADFAPVFAENSINGLPTVRFDPVLGNEMFGSPPTPFPWAICSVVKIMNTNSAAWGDEGYIIMGTTSASPTALVGIVTSAEIAAGYNIISQYGYDINEGLRVNGVLKDDESLGEEPTPWGLFTLGSYGTRYLQGNIAEIIIFPYTDDNISSVEAYLSGKYGIPLV